MAQASFITVNSTCLININEAARQLNIKIPTLRSWVFERKLAYVKAGRLVKFDQADVNLFIESRKVKALDF